MEKKVLLNKQSVRSKYLAYRDNLSKGERIEKSRKLWENLKEEKEFLEAEIVLVYMDYRSEVITTFMVEELLKPESGKRVFAPRVDGLEIHFFEIHSMSDLHEGYQGIREPDEALEQQFTQELLNRYQCLLLMPGAVFDRELGRMGYGKGFYDRFLQRYPDLVRAGIAFECQVAKKIPMQAHDKQVHFIVTENGVLR